MPSSNRVQLALYFFFVADLNSLDTILPSALATF